MNFFVRKFYKEMENDPTFRKKILDAKEKYDYLKEPKDKLCTIIEKVILPLSEKKGYNFDIYDLLIFEEESSVSGAQLMEEPMLERVSGGIKNANEKDIFCASSVLNMSDICKDISTYWYEKKNYI